MNGNPDRTSAAQSPLLPSRAEIEGRSGAPALSFDAEAYRHFLADCDWTDEQKDEFTEALWQIVLNFVDLGFGLHPAQQVGNNMPTLAADSPSVVASDENSNNITPDGASVLAGTFAEEERFHD
jgi:hypothetical protein